MLSHGLGQQQTVEVTTPLRSFDMCPSERNRGTRRHSLSVPHGKELLTMTDETQAYDSLDAFCVEYGFDAATTKRMRDEMVATASAQEGSRRTRERADQAVRARADRGVLLHEPVQAEPDVAFLLRGISG